MPGDDPAVTKLHPQTLGWSLFTIGKGSRELTIPKRSQSQNCQASEFFDVFTPGGLPDDQKLVVG